MCVPPSFLLERSAAIASGMSIVGNPPSNSALTKTCTTYVRGSTMKVAGLLAVLAVICVVCSGSALPAAFRPQSTLVLKETPCEACENLVTLVKAYIANPTTQQHIMNYVLEEICPKLPEEDRQYCAIYTPIAVAAAAGWVASRESATVCGDARLCPATAEPSAVDSGDLQQKYLAAILQSAPVSGILATACKRHALALGDDCDTCKVAVTEVAAILADPDTQKEILDYAKQACDTFPEFHDQCLTYVEMYGPLLLNAAIGYMTTDLCVRLGVCVS